MAIIITDDCINCGACEPECPNTAIYEGAAKWKFSDGTGFAGKDVLFAQWDVQRGYGAALAANFRGDAKR